MCKASNANQDGSQQMEPILPGVFGDDGCFSLDSRLDAYLECGGDERRSKPSHVSPRLILSFAKTPEEQAAALGISRVD